MNWGREGFTRARRQHPAEYVQCPILTTFVFCFDVTRPPFDDVRVRQAFAMTFDRASSLPSVLAQN